MNNTSRHSLSFPVTQNSPHLTQLLPPSLRSFKELCLALPVPSGNRHGRRRENPNRIWEASFWLESTIFHRNFSIFQHSRNGFVVVFVGFMIKSQYTGNLTGYNSRPASHLRALVARHPAASFWHLKNCSTWSTELMPMLQRILLQSNSPQIAGLFWTEKDGSRCSTQPNFAADPNSIYTLPITNHQLPQAWTRLLFCWNVLPPMPLEWPSDSMIPRFSQCGWSWASDFLIDSWFFVGPWIWRAFKI